ncbi:kinase-like domain-containing protein [Cristinia sonorae]|uniref:Kinase-like domain-containing protein n=1 Tax=Cristinia sonorae TaxID=1940300 RepID=A0A8K0XMA4_9AGAR|nr:kinase-like domain-containing protein [Cristinia sonorae]
MRRALPTPSRAAKSQYFNKNQKNVGTAIYNGCFSPGGSFTPLAPPIEIFHPVFDSFKRYVTGPDITLDQTLVENVSKAMTNAAEIIVSEDKGNDQMQSHLAAILSRSIRPVQSVGSTNADGKITIEIDGREISIGVFGRQRRLGEGGCDPITKAEYSTLNCWSKEGMRPYVNASCCPTFILATAGAWLTIFGFVIIGSPIEVVAQPLVDIMWLGEATPYEDTHVYNVARVFNALRRCLDELEAYYRGLTLPPTSSPTPASFPYPTVYTCGEDEFRFKYVCRLEEGAWSATFLAETEDETSKLVVKFVDRYGADAHRLLANAGYAPALHYFGTLDGRTPTTTPDVMKSGLYVGPVRMVVMEYVEGTTLHDAVRDGEDIPANVRQEIAHALSILHNAGFVYGDLRSPNVMLSKSSLKLIDFDWAGKEGVATYPRRLSKDIRWAKGVADFAPMRKAHDLEMLDKVFLV